MNAILLSADYYLLCQGHNATGCSTFCVHLCYFCIGTVVEQFCKQNPAGYYADTSHCTRYIECIDGMSRHLSCPDATYFNADINACMLLDRQSEAACSRRLF